MGGRGLFGGGPGHGGRLDGAGPLKLYPSELREVGSLGLTRVCEGAGIVYVYVVVWKGCEVALNWRGCGLWVVLVLVVVVVVVVGSGSDVCSSVV